MFHRTEAAPSNPERAKTLRNWDMEAQPGHPEQRFQLLKRIGERLKIWHEDEDPDYPDNILEVSAAVDADGLVNIAQFERRAAYKWLDATDANKGWWNQLHRARDIVPDNLFEKEPTEQFIVGQGEKGVRFYNYAEPLSDEHQDDLQAFIDVATQYMGDRTYDVLQDVVITDFKDKDTGGVAFDLLRGVLFINASVLQNPLDRDGDAKGHELLQTLGHEFDHVIEWQETDSKRKRNIGEFATRIGWNPGIRGRDPHEQIAAYRPPAVDQSTDKEVQAPNGYTRVLTQDEYVSTYLPSIEKQSTRDEHGKPLDVLVGSPTEYGATSPMESAAETTRHAMFGQFMLNHLMPETRDAWLDLTWKRRRGDIVVPLDREPIAIERRTGDDILYPRAHLPRQINVRLVPSKEQSKAGA